MLIVRRIAPRAFFFLALRDVFRPGRVERHLCVPEARGKKSGRDRERGEGGGEGEGTPDRFTSGAFRISVS